MLSYLHGFHAGNFADVQKHAAQVLALRMMQAKPSGIACFDTHAGSALYDLDSDRAQKTGEADDGIRRLWQARPGLAGDDWQPLLDVLASLNRHHDSLSRYPGSPEWFRRFQRDQDALTLFELHPTESEHLQSWAGQGNVQKRGKKSVQVFREDGLSGLLRQLPPRQPRLMVLMDPSYEVKTEYEQVAETLARAWKKCRHGVFLVWYPILTSALEQALKQAIVQGPLKGVLCSEIHLERPPQRGMTGSGMLVVNPPWGFGERLTQMLESVSGTSGDGLSVKASLSWLVPE